MVNKRSFSGKAVSKNPENVFSVHYMVFALLLLCLGGCTQARHQAPLVERPPTVQAAAFDTQMSQNRHGKSRTRELASLEPAAGHHPDIDAAYQENLALANDKVSRDCRVRDRFDRQALLAYHWGGHGENRLGVDVDGVGLDSARIRGLKVAYTLRLQPQKTKKERCRYASSWQGLVGSGYNELVLREKDTVWSHMKRLQGDVESRFETFTGR